ncbi:MAG: glycoside hydrolase family 16 protein [Lachnospiraceae bacterium]|nr:glycoside hydrolase family 16 protein [Lachnospiraceae bacterium]
MKEYKVEGHVSSYLPEGKEWKLVWSDEFDGPELDTSKWEFRMNFWGKPFEAYTDKGLVFDGNSCLEMHRTERDGYYVGPTLQTGSLSYDMPLDEEEREKSVSGTDWKIGKLHPAKFLHRYGYYEIRCKFMKYPETMWAAFWTQSPSIGASYDPEWCGVESDIMECFNKGRITTGNIMGGYGPQRREDGRVWYDLKDTEDDFHTFAMDWSPEGYVFYCDGEVVSTASEHVSHIPQFILLTSEVQGWRKGKGGPPAVGEKFEDDAFIVDYVRVFDQV